MFKITTVKFIELHNLDGNKVIAINPAGISGFGPHFDNRGGSWVALIGDCNAFSVIEEYEDIKKAIIAD